MRILELTAENVKRLKVVSIKPPAGLVQVTGKNGSGKTSVLDSIWWALGGEKGIQAVPIRNGEERASIKLDLGELIVERTFLPSGTTRLTVRKGKDSKPEGSPQTLLDAIMGELSFDPLAFTRMAAKQQFEELRRIAKVNYDFDAAQKATTKDYEDRKNLNRDAKTKRIAAEAITVPDGLPKQPIDESAILAEINAASKHNQAVAEQAKAVDVLTGQAERKREQAAEALARIETGRADAAKRIAELENQIAEVKRSQQALQTSNEAFAAAANKEAEELERKAHLTLPNPISIEETTARLSAARETNAAIHQREKKSAMLREVAEMEARSDALSAQMEGREIAKRKAIKSAALPVEGLGFGADHITFEGVPFNQASDAQQLRVSIAIAMAGNPSLRVIRVRDGSLLDDDAVKIIAELAAEKDYQIWLERVDSSGKVGIVMEDGEVKGATE